MITNQKMVFAKRPVGEPGDECFRLEESPVPPLQDNQILIKVCWLSLDPYMRGRMHDVKSYAAPMEIGDVMVGETTGIVIQSTSDAYAVGDRVAAHMGWQSYIVADADDPRLMKVDLANGSLSAHLGVVGMPGRTAYFGLTEVGKPQPGETLVVAAASGAVGSVVGQIARIKGLRAVGIAGGPEKCRYVKEELHFDACIDYKAGNLAAELAAACPHGIDIYFENVGGAVFDAVLPLLNSRARVPVCGVVAQYNATGLPDGPDRLPLLLETILKKRLRMQGFIIFDDYGHRYDEFYRDMSAWYADGRIKYREQQVQGLENAPEAFIGLLEGRNFGKLVVALGES